MATVTPNFNWPVPTSTDLVKDGATAIEALGDSIDASLLDLKGGTSGQVLAKNSNTDMDFIWVAQDDSNAIQNTIVDAKGDLISATAADTPARLAVGTNGHVLTADSAAATGIKWAAPAGGGKVLQLVQSTYSTNTVSTSTSFVDVGMSVTITPTLSTSKILVLVSNTCYAETTSSASEVAVQLVRGATVVSTVSPAVFRAGTGIAGAVNMTYLDSPATTSATTYKIQARNISAGGTFYYQYNSSMGTITAIEIGA